MAAANLAIALLRLGEPETMWALLAHTPDPTIRTLLMQEAKVALARDLLGGKVAPATLTLVTRAVATPRARSLTAAVLELGRLLSARPTRRSVLFLNFSGEELGLLGSQYLVEHSPVPLDSMVAMLNFDMVGRLRGDSLIVYGVATARELPALLDSANAPGEIVAHLDLAIHCLRKALPPPWTLSAGLARKDCSPA